LRLPNTYKLKENKNVAKTDPGYASIVKTYYECAEADFNDCVINVPDCVDLKEFADPIGFIETTHLSFNRDILQETRNVEIDGLNPILDKLFGQTGYSLDISEKWIMFNRRNETKCPVGDWVHRVAN